MHIKKDQVGKNSLPGMAQGRGKDCCLRRVECYPMHLGETWRAKQIYIYIYIKAGSLSGDNVFDGCLGDEACYQIAHHSHVEQSPAKIAWNTHPER